MSQHGGWNNNDHQQSNLGRFRLSVTAAKDAVADPLPKRVREILAIPAARRSPAQEAVVFAYWRTIVPEFKEANEQDRRPLQTMARGDDRADLNGSRAGPHDRRCSSGATGSSPARRSRPACPPSCTRFRRVTSRRG